MKIGIVGLPTSGKSTLFNALTHGHAETGHFGAGGGEINRGRVLVPDERLDWLNELYSPKKKTPATCEFLDVPGLSPGSHEKGAAARLADLRTVDALLHVVRVFDDPKVPHPDGSVSPRRDADALETELLLADLAVVEKRLERIESDLGKGLDRRALGEEKERLERIRGALEEGKGVRSVELDDDERQRLRGYAFLTLKPMIVLGNVGETEPGGGDSDLALREFAQEAELPYLAVSAKIEEEISQMPEEDAAAFLDDLGLTEASRDRVVRAGFDLLSLLTFFTFGEDECKAWTLTRGGYAVEAAGKIHSDIARGFIRAEIVAFDDFRSAGTWAGAKDVGKFRLEGKDYVMHDGDCVVFRFNV